MSGALAVDVLRCGVIGPGLPDWAAARAILRGEQAYQPAPLAKPVALALPQRERRRHTFTIAIAVSAAIEAAGGLEGLESGNTPAVFACSGGDTDVIDRICGALVQSGHPVSPQQFINSVHNAPAGYWSIAAQNTAATVSLSAYDGSFAAGLLEAAAQIRAGEGKPEKARVLLVAYDVPAPEPIWPFRPLAAPFAVALMLAAPDGDGRPLARLRLALRRELAEADMAEPELEALRRGNPAARSLPLLQAIAAERAAAMALPYLPPQGLQVEVAPC